MLGSLIRRCRDALPVIEPSGRWELAKALANLPEVNEEVLRAVVEQSLPKGSPTPFFQSKAWQNVKQIALDELQPKIQRAIYYNLLLEMTGQEAKEFLKRMNSTKDFSRQGTIFFPGIRSIRWKEAEEVARQLKIGKSSSN